MEIRHQFHSLFRSQGVIPGPAVILGRSLAVLPRTLEMLNPTMAARRTCAPARASARMALGQLKPTPAVVVPIVKGRGYCCYCKSPKHRTSRCATVIKPITSSASSSPAALIRSSHTAAAANYSSTSTPPSQVSNVASLTHTSSALRSTLRSNGQASLRSTFPRSATLISASNTPRPAPLSYNNTITSSHRSFTSSAANMVAQKIDGNAIAKEIREGLHAQIDEKRRSNPRFNPSLKIIQGAYP